MTKNNFFWYALIFILLISAGSCGFHLFLLQFEPLVRLRLPAGLFAGIYVYLVPLTLASVWVVYHRFLKDHTAAGKTFFLMVFVKIIVSAVYLFPDFIIPKALSKEFVIQFMPVFFVLLFIETYLLIRLLNLPLDEFSKNDQNQ